MGRPPIGKQAMTSAERHQRFIDKFRAADRAEIDQLRARVAELERAAKSGPKLFDALMKENAELRRQQPEIERLRAQIRKLEGAIAAKPKAPRAPKPEPGSREDLEKQIRKLRRDYVHLQQAYSHCRAARASISAAERRLILSCLHPDQADPAKRKRYQEAFQVFNDLAIKDAP